MRHPLLEITQCSVQLITPRTGHKFSQYKAVASIVLNEQIIINKMMVCDAITGLFVGYPSQQSVTDENTYNDLCYPISHKLRESIETRVLEDYRKAIAQNVKIKTAIAESEL